MEIRAELRPTEDLERILKAIRNVFGVEEYRVVDEEPYKIVVAESRDIKSLLKLHELLRQSRILDTARKVMTSGRREGAIVFKIHKQGAYAGKVSFVTFDTESPLGPIEVRIYTDKPDEVIDWLAPKTSKGKPLWNRPMPEV